MPWSAGGWLARTIYRQWSDAGLALACKPPEQIIRGVAMKVLSVEKSKLLADQNGWSLEFAQGFVDGETSRRLGKAPALLALVGIDERSMGFRAGYFERQNRDLAQPAKSEMP